MSKHQLVQVMGILFRVWEGTENADLILEDVCNTISHELLHLDSDGRREFLAASKKAGEHP